jgi:hypothetical protein
MQYEISAQNKLTDRFGNVTPKDFDLTQYRIDSGASVVVIADIGESHFERENISGVRLVFTRHKRVKIINKNAFDMGTVEIPISLKGKTGDQLRDLIATTYNLENGKVLEQKLDANSVFTVDYSNDVKLKKFAFPGLKEGSIIEYSYTLHTDIRINLRSWEFQGKYPCLWSEYTVTIPEWLTYIDLEQGMNPFFINTTDYNVSSGVKLATHHWAMKDVPAMQEEKYTTTINNYISKVEFQLQSITSSGISNDVIPGWPKIAAELMESKSFGANLSKTNHWLDGDLATITRDTHGNLEKAEKIYAYVRDNFECVKQQQTQIVNSLEDVFKNKAGSDGEINLLLCAMLNHEGIHSDPILLSTRSHGFVSEAYPKLDRYNKTICNVHIDSLYYFLDASRKYLSFNHLAEDCYNGQAMVINAENTFPVYFAADALKESKQTSVFILNDEGHPRDMVGSFQSNLGYYESYKLREKIAKTSETDYFKELKSFNKGGIEIDNAGVDSLTHPDNPLVEHFNLTFKNISDVGIIYFNPIIAVAIGENPFKSTERKYPVEMPYTIDEVYSLEMDIPKGYRIEEMPKSAKVLLNETDGFFEYMIGHDETSIHLHTRIKLNRANYLPSDYNSLRDFYTYIIKKQGEQIVFKKIN